MTESSDIDQSSTTGKNKGSADRILDVVRHRHRVVSPSTLWKYCCMITLLFWGILIAVMMLCAYFPPPEQGAPTIESLIDALQFFTFTLTGVTFGYPFIAYFLREG